MKTLLIPVLVAALALPAFAAAEGDYTLPPSHAASAACKKERAAMGTAAFKLAYGTNKTRSNALGKCISRHTKTERTNQSNAAKACTAEQNDPNFAAGHDGKTFDQFYATNKKGKNAYGKCVSDKAKAASNADVKADVNAARQCKKDRKDADAFRAAWGSKRNAFGKCVSAMAKELHA